MGKASTRRKPAKRHSSGLRCICGADALVRGSVSRARKPFRSGPWKPRAAVESRPTGGVASLPAAHDEQCHIVGRQTSLAEAGDVRQDAVGHRVHSLFEVIPQRPDQAFLFVLLAGLILAPP